MAKSLHILEFRAQVSQRYLDGAGSYISLANKYGIGIKTLIRCVAKHRLYGIVAFENKSGNDSYTCKFKVIVPLSYF